MTPTAESPLPGRRRGRPRAERATRPDVPYTMKLADGRCVFVEIPRRFVERDRAGSIALTPDGVRFLDRIRSLALDSDRAPSPAFLTTLREALGHTQAALARRLGVDKLTVSRWERGAMRPSRDSVRALFRLRREATRRGVVL